MAHSRPHVPERIYEANIVHNPLLWMGVWTPQGWRVHAKRWGRAVRKTLLLSGDGHSSFFPDVLRDPGTHRVEWSDDLHLKDDSFTDCGIYPCDPRVEYPVELRRWAVSHTLLCYPVADHTLFTHEYTWDLVHGHLKTHFRRHVVLEASRTDARDGMTVAVQHRPLSTTIEGNANYPLPNSAVRGVWDNPDKIGDNFYTQRAVQLLAMHNAVYCIPRRTPVVQCHGMYAVAEAEGLDAVFDSDTGDCRDTEYLQERLAIPLDEPKIGMLRFPIKRLMSRIYDGPIGVPAELYGVVSAEHVENLRSRMGSRFQPTGVGYAHDGRFDADQGAPGYIPAFDFNGDGLIDGQDLEVAHRHVGRRVRYNLYLDGYFGGDWLTTSACLEPEHRSGIPVIADYQFGGGYDADAGVIRLLKSPGRDQPVWVEYFYDAPAEAGENNIRLHIYRELD